MQQGLLYCGSSINWSDTFCITKLIEAIFSALLIFAIFYEVVAQIKQTGSFTYRFVEIMQTLMIFTLIYNIAFALLHTIYYLFYLQSLFYDWYFCTLVFYVTYKIFNKHPKENKNLILAVKICFSIMILAFVGIFIYSVVVDIQACQEIWFLVVDFFGLIACLIMIIVGKNHERREIQKILDFSNSEQIKNPLSRMWILIVVNLVCQILQLIQSLVYIFQTETSCAFTSNEVANKILKLLFSLFSLHTSFICTILLFRFRRKGQMNYRNMNQRALTVDSTQPNYLEMSPYRKSTLNSKVSG